MRFDDPAFGSALDRWITELPRSLRRAPTERTLSLEVAIYPDSDAACGYDSRWYGEATTTATDEVDEYGPTYELSDVVDVAWQDEAPPPEVLALVVPRILHELHRDAEGLCSDGQIILDASQPDAPRSWRPVVCHTVTR